MRNKETMYKYLLEKYPNREGLLDHIFTFYNLDKNFDISLVKYGVRRCGKTTIKNVCVIIDFLEDIVKGKDKITLSFMSQRRYNKYLETCSRFRVNEIPVVYSNDMWARHNYKKISSYLKSLELEGMRFGCGIITYKGSA